MSRLNPSRKSIAVGIAIAFVATVVLVPTARSQISSADINQIIQQLTGGTSNNGGTVTPPIVTPPTDGGSTGGGSTGGGGTGTTTDARLPQIIQNQFTTTKGAALSERAPGNWVSQGIAFQQTGEPAPLGNPNTDQSFFKETLLLMFSDVIDSINGFLDTLNLGIIFGGIGGGSGITPISNAATTGQGTMTAIP